jgi:hypothetical protein
LLVSPSIIQGKCNNIRVGPKSMGMSSSHQRIMGVPYQTRIQTSCLSYRRNFIQVGWLCCSLPEEFSNTVNKKVFLVSVDGTHVALNMTFLYEACTCKQGRYALHQLRYKLIAFLDHIRAEKIKNKFFYQQQTVIN